MKNYDEIIVETIMSIPDAFFINRENRKYCKAIEEIIYIDVQQGSYRLDCAGKTFIDKKSNKEMYLTRIHEICSSKEETIEKWLVRQEKDKAIVRKAIELHLQNKKNNISK